MAFDLATAKPVSGGFDLKTAKPVQAEAAQAAQIKPERNDALDAANAAVTGYQRGLVNLAGLPVDTVANARDLAKAGAGYAYSKLSGKPVPSWLELGDRANDVGSSAYLLKKIRSGGGSMFVDPSNPEYEGGLVQTAGTGAAGAMTPNQLAMGAASAIAGKKVYDATGNEALAIAAGMAPTLARQGFTEATKRVVRGGEAGRQNMIQRIADLRSAGIDEPTLGPASGNKTIGGIENLLQSTPGAVGVMSRARDKALSGMEEAANRAADLASTNRGAMESGRPIQAGGKAFKENFKAAQEQLYNKLDQFIDPQAPVGVSNTKATLAELNSDIKGAPALSKQFKNGRLLAIEEAINQDTAGAPQSVQVFARPAVGGGGLMNAPVEQAPVLVNIPAGPSRNTLPFEAVKKTRTLVGNEIADNSLMSDVPRSKWNPLYGALSEDMQAAATAAGPRAENALNRANNYTRSGIERMERIAPVVDRPAPEQSFTALANTLKENVSTFQAVKKSLPEDARGQFAGTIIERLGKATPGQQDATGGKWSPETFLTNWNRMKPDARSELLSGIPNAAEVESLVDSVARASSMMRDSSKMWANPSGTAANATARGVLGAVAAGGAGSLAGLMNPAVPLAAAAGLGGVNLLARGLTSNRVRDAMTKRTEIDPAAQNALIRALAANGQLGQ